MPPDYSEPLTNFEKILKDQLHAPSSTIMGQQGCQAESSLCFWQGEVRELHTKAARLVAEMERTKRGWVTVTFVLPGNLKEPVERSDLDYTEMPKQDEDTMPKRCTVTIVSLQRPFCNRSFVVTRLFAEFAARPVSYRKCVWFRDW